MPLMRLNLQGCILAWVVVMNVLWSDKQAYEGNPVDVDAVINALLATDLSPASLAAAEAAALGLIFKPPPKKSPGQGAP